MKKRNVVIISIAALFVIGQFTGSDEPNLVATNSPSATQSQTSEIRTPTSTSEPEAGLDSSDNPTPEAESTSSPETTATATESTQSATPEPAATEEPEESTQPANNQTEEADSLIAELLAQLDIEAESNLDYDRDYFRHWIDADRDGCDARREVLIAEAVVAPVIGDRCELIGGSWYSAFDGVTTEDDSSFDVDHMVPLKEAWQSGAHAWSAERRQAFANDLDLPEALIAVSASSNRSKSDRDPADWLPLLTSYRCDYLEDWLKVKVKWELSVDQREFQAMRDVLLLCP